MCEWRLGWIKRNYTLDDEVGNCEGIHYSVFLRFWFRLLYPGSSSCISRRFGLPMDCSHLSSFFLGTGRLEAAISVNSVVGAHFLVSRDFSFYSVCNELILVLIGITAALLLNLFYDYSGSKKSIIANMCYWRTSSR